MNMRLEIGGRNYFVVLETPYDISIPLKFNEAQPNTYNIPIATAKAVETDGLVGDTRRGGSCNFEAIQLIPHCNGTHTECVGHISLERISIYDTLSHSLCPTVVITVQPVNGEDCGDTYTPPLEKTDWVITRKSLAQLEEINRTTPEWLEAIVIRTLPNDISKRTRQYEQRPPPFFSKEAIEFLSELPVLHLLVDFPSLDRTYDEGKLFVHHRFWNVEQGSRDVDTKLHSLRTVTEFVFIENYIPDGKYFLNLQVAPFHSDAAPSRPVLYKIKEVN